MDPLKTERQQRRSTIGLILWSGVALLLLLGIPSLASDDVAAVRLISILEILGAVLLAYLAGRWREL